jgi:hypothetical protein
VIVYRSSVSERKHGNFFNTSSEAILVQGGPWNLDICIRF